MSELFSETSRSNLFKILEALQHGLDAGLKHSNMELVHQGLRNMGDRPIDTINLYLDSV